MHGILCSHIGVPDFLRRGALIPYGGGAVNREGTEPQQLSRRGGPVHGRMGPHGDRHGGGGAYLPVPHAFTAGYYRDLHHRAPSLFLLLFSTVPGEGIFKPVTAAFLPAAVVLVIEIIFHLQPVGIRREIIAEVFARDSYHPFKILIFTGSLFILSYMYRVFREVVAVRNEEEVRRSARAVMAANFLAVMGIIFLSTGLVTARQGILRLGNILVALLLVTIFLAHRRYPEFFQILKREICARRYHNSMLGGIDTESLYHQVLAMMTEERLYRDADLSLQKLADLLSITPHQLSEFFNNRLSMNFPMFINVYRVEEAKRILIDEPEAGILSICYQAGFNSKSSFNTVFKKQTGMTPSSFAGKTGNSSPIKRPVL